MAAPRQDRSRKTHEALLDAAERLLRKRPWEEIAIVEIMREAGCSNGAIYGRFKGKDDLLVALYERHEARLRADDAARARRKPRKNESFENFLRREIDGLIHKQRENRWLLRAMGLLSRIDPDVLSPEARAKRRAIFERIESQLLEHPGLAARGSIDWRDPKRGMALAVFFVATIVREAVLYQGPHYRGLDLDDDELGATLTHMALRFLGIPSRRKPK